MIGGHARNMHKGKRALKITGTGGKDKTLVMGILERGGKVRTKVIANRKKTTVQKELRKHVEAGSAIYTDALKSYEGLSEFQHGIIDHAIALRRWENPYQWLGELLVIGKARTEGHVHQRRTIPSVPVPR